MAVIKNDPFIISFTMFGLLGFLNYFEVSFTTLTH